MDTWQSRAGKNMVRALCAYELTATAPSFPLPTLTALCKRYRRCWAGRTVIAAGLGWLAYHLCLEPA